LIPWKKISCRWTALAAPLKKKMGFPIYIIISIRGRVPPGSFQPCPFIWQGNGVVGN